MIKIVLPILFILSILGAYTQGQCGLDKKAIVMIPVSFDKNGSKVVIKSSGKEIIMCVDKNAKLK